MISISSDKPGCDGTASRACTLSFALSVSLQGMRWQAVAAVWFPCLLEGAKLQFAEQKQSTTEFCSLHVAI